MTIETEFNLGWNAAVAQTAARTAKSLFILSTLGLDAETQTAAIKALAHSLHSSALDALSLVRRIDGALKNG